MTIKEFYEAVSGDYEDTLGRMMKEERILKYLNKFKDSQDYENLLKSIEEDNIEEIFRNSHSLKGVALNLGLSKLAKDSSDFCDLFRNGRPETDYSELLELVKEDYKTVIENIKTLTEQ